MIYDVSQELRGVAGISSVARMLRV